MCVRVCVLACACVRAPKKILFSLSNFLSWLTFYNFMLVSRIYIYIYIYIYI